ncbi:MAG: ATP-binding cassette domain-containing protein [Oscillospiraceae bacterium]|nr:ATP-binding cassette domain-containing protein [Oscillospiraceae bacterium]
MGTEVLRIENLYMNFSFVRALIDVNISLRTGEIHALVGGNGAGKSTLSNIICGHIKPKSGGIYIYGKRQALKTPADARRLGIGTVHQKLAMAEDLDVAANMFLGRELLKPPPLSWLNVMDKKKMYAAATEEMKRLKISLPSVKAKARSLSGGQKQGVACARALMGNMPILILDEPTAALGVRETAEMISIVERCRDEGIAIMLISHNMKEVFAISQRITVLRLGRVVAQGRQTASFTEDDVVSLITGSIEHESEIPYRNR